MNVNLVTVRLADHDERDARTLEVLARIGAFPVAASAGGGSPGARFVLHPLDGEFAALPPAIGPAVVGELLTVVGQCPGPQFDPVTGVQRL